MKIALHFYDLCGKCQGTELQCFLLNAPQFSKRTAFSRQRHLTQDCALRHFCHQSVALLVGESGAIHVIFSSAAVPRLLHSFWHVPYMYLQHQSVPTHFSVVLPQQYVLVLTIEMIDMSEHHFQIEKSLIS